MTNVRFWQVAALVTTIIAAIFIGWYLTNPPEKPGKLIDDPALDWDNITLVVIADNSKSAEELYKYLAAWIIRLFSQYEADANLVFCRMAVKTVPFVTRKGLPTPEELKSGGLKDLLALEQVPGTRPLTAIEFGLNYARQNSSRPIAIVIFTDGENDYPGNKPRLEQACKELASSPNILRIGLFGLDPLDPDKVADWNRYFSNCSKVLICTRYLGSTEQGLNQFCELVEKDRRNSGEPKGR